jgi:hypothetical protein
LKLINRSDILEKSTATKPPIEDPRLGLKENETPWIPEALTIPYKTTKTTTATTKAPYV